MLSCGRKHIRSLLSLSGSCFVLYVVFKFMFYFMLSPEGGVSQLIVNIFCRGVFSANYRRALNRRRGRAERSRARGTFFSLDYPNDIRDNGHRKNSYPMLISCLSYMHPTITKVAFLLGMPSVGGSGAAVVILCCRPRAGLFS